MVEEGLSEGGLSVSVPVLLDSLYENGGLDKMRPGMPQ
jgi:hypothetical protein